MDSDDNIVPLLIESDVANVLNNECSDMSESEMIEYTKDETEIVSQDRPQKRNRELDSEEVWTTIARKAKKFSRTAVDKSSRIAEDNTEVCMTSADKLPKQFGLAKLLKSENIQNVIKVKYINPYKVLLQFNCDNSADALTQSEVFKEKGYKCQKTLEINQSFGVIKDIDLELSDEEIMEGLCSGTVILGVKRLKRRNSENGQWEMSEAVRVCFKGTSLPSYVYIYDTRVIVNTYTYPVTQCSRCWRFGHTIRMCPSLKIICPKCSRHHANCETCDFKCSNCTGKHMAMAKLCPVYLKEKKLRELMSEFNCSYKRAVTLYVAPSPIPSERQPLSTVRRTSVEILEHSRSVQSTNELEAQKLLKSNPNPTYLSVTKQSQHKTEQRSKAERRREKRKIRNEKEDDYMTESSENEKRYEEESSNNNKAKKELLSWRVILNKLREKLFEAENTWEDKMKSCCSILFEGLLSFIMQYIGDTPCCNFIKQLWITTKQTYL